MSIWDDISGVLILVGCALSLRVYWWLFVTPIVRLFRRRATKRTVSRVIWPRGRPPRAPGHPARRHSARGGATSLWPARILVGMRVGVGMFSAVLETARGESISRFTAKPALGFPGDPRGSVLELNPATDAPGATWTGWNHRFGQGELRC